MADKIRHLMQVARAWADEHNDPETGRSDTLEIALRAALAQHTDDQLRTHRLIVAANKNAAMWHGKWAIVKQENNALRRKLYTAGVPDKTGGQG